MMLSALAISLAIGQGQDAALEARVTFESAGQAVPALVDGLAKAAHVPLSAPKAFQNDVLVVRVKDAPLREVLTRIGDLTAADWQKKDSQYVLVRSTAKLHAEEEEARAAEIALFQRAIDKEKKKLANLEPWSDKTAQAIAVTLADMQKSGSSNGVMNAGAWQRLQAIDSRAPAGRAMTRVMARLDARLLADLPADYKIVFSDQPTPLQRPLPAGVAQSLSDLATEQNLWSEVAGRILAEPQGGGYYSSAMWMKKPFEGKVGKILLTVTKNSGRGDLGANVELIAADQKGRIVTRSNSYLSSTGDELGGSPPAPTPGEKQIVPSTMTLAMKALFEGSRGAVRHEPPSKELVNQLLHPEEHEPLALATGEMLLQIAGAKSENLIAALPDRSFLFGGLAAQGNQTPSVLLKLIAWMGLDSSEEDGWLVISSKSSLARDDRLDRQILGEFLRKAFKKGKTSLDDLAAYSVQVKGDVFSSMGIVLSQLLSAGQDSTYYDANLLRFYGSLDVLQRQTLAKGGQLLITSLSPAETDALNKMIFGQNSLLQPVVRPGAGVGPEDWDLFYNGIAREPTELFARGMPSNSVVKLSQIATRVMIAPPYQTAQGIIYGAETMGPDDVAMRMYAKERPGIFPWMDGQPAIADRKFTFGTVKNLSFHFEFGTLAQMGMQLQDTTPDFSDPLPFDQMPDDFKKTVQDKLAEIRKNYANVKPGQLGGPVNGGSSTPPPPRP